MVSLFWLFAGILTGLLITSVFSPADHKTKSIPTPNDVSPLHTETGCVKFRSEEIPCDGHEDSLNVIASKHK